MRSYRHCIAMLTVVAFVPMPVGCGGEEVEELEVGNRSIALQQEVYNWVPLLEKHFQPKHVTWAMHIMNCESGGNPNAYNGTDPYGGACGLFQHLKHFFPQRATAAGFSGASPFNPEANIAAAAWLLYNGGGKSNWTCKHYPFEDWSYTSQGYQGQSGYQEQSSWEPGGGSFIGESCSHGVECGGDKCLTESGQRFPGGMCTMRCGVGDSGMYGDSRLCPDMAGKPTTFCARVHTPLGTRGLCFRRCDSISDCRGGYYCSNHAFPRFGQVYISHRICVPPWAANRNPYEGKADSPGFTLDSLPSDANDPIAGCSVVSNPTGEGSGLTGLILITITMLGFTLLVRRGRARKLPG